MDGRCIKRWKYFVGVLLGHDEHLCIYFKSRYGKCLQNLNANTCVEITQRTFDVAMFDVFFLNLFKIEEYLNGQYFYCIYVGIKSANKLYDFIIFWLILGKNDA